MDLISHYRLRKLASDDGSTVGRKLSGVAGAVAGAVGADRLHRQVIKRSPKYAKFIYDVADRGSRSSSRLGQYGRLLGLGALAVTPLAIGSYGGYKTGTRLYDRANDR